MKAIRVHSFGGPEMLKWEDVTDCKAGPGQVVVEVKAAGVNPVETYIRAGIYGPRQFPFTPGSDAAGVVAEVGAGVQRHKIGDRVYAAGSITGTYAEKTLCDQSSVYPLPEHNAFEQGAAVGVPYATAYRGAIRARAQGRAGEMVLVHGASGGVGTAAVQLARAFGFTVFGTAGTDKGIALTKQNGAHHVLNHHDPDYLKRLMDLTGGVGVDIILEMVAHKNLAKDLGVLAKSGRVIVIGSRGPIEINPRDAMARNADIRAMSLMNVTPVELARDQQAIIAGLESGSLRPVIGKSFPMAEASKAHEAVMEGGAYGKIVLLPQASPFHRA